MKRFIYYIMPIVAVLFWSGNNIAGKLAVTNTSASSLSFYRWALATILLTPFLLKASIKYYAVIKKYFIKLVIISALGMVIYQSLSYVAAHFIPASDMGIIMGLIPLMALVISMPIFKFRLTWGAALGILISLYGIVFFLSGGHPSALISHFGVGDVIMLIAALSYALYGVLIKYWKIPLPTHVLMYVQVVIATTILIPIYLLGPISPINSSNISIIIYAGLFSSIAAPFLWIIALHKLGPHDTAIFMNFMPIFTAAIAVLLLGERVQWFEYFGGALIIIGVLLSQCWITPIIKNKQIRCST